MRKFEAFRRVERDQSDAEALLAFVLLLAIKTEQHLVEKTAQPFARTRLVFLERSDQLVDVRFAAERLFRGSARSPQVLPISNGGDQFPEDRRLHHQRFMEPRFESIHEGKKLI